MTPPTPTRQTSSPGQPPDTIHGAAEVQGPLVRQPAPAARLARILHHSAQDLWEVCTLTDPAQMWEEARAVASRILASCPTR
jgi:hypothetical protein